MLLDLGLHFLARIRAEIVEAVEQRIGTGEAEDRRIAERVDDQGLAFVVAIEKQPAPTAAHAGLVAKARATEHLVAEISVNVNMFAGGPRVPGVLWLRLLVLSAAVAPVPFGAVLSAAVAGNVGEKLARLIRREVTKQVAGELAQPGLVGCGPAPATRTWRRRDGQRAKRLPRLVDGRALAHHRDGPALFAV